MNRDEAAIVIRELLETCREMDDVYLCMVPPTASTPIATGGYQIHIKTKPTLDKAIAGCVETVTKKHQLTAQEIKAEEKMIIYRKH